MKDSDTKRISRLIAILTQLQTRRIQTSTALAEKFGVSARTIFRDLKALEQAGVPLLTEEGKGFSLMEGYKIPPVMFTESEANALVTAEQLVLKNRENSLIREYSGAIHKIKAVLGYAAKEKVDLLSKRMSVSRVVSKEGTSDSLALIQGALISFRVMKITYVSDHKKQKTQRQVEPFAFYYSLEESWLLIAYCRLRKDYRMFRLDRMVNVEVLELNFKPHKLSLKEYLDHKERHFKHP